MSIHQNILQSLSRNRRFRLGLILLLPAVVFTISVIGYPLFQMINLSFRSFNLMRPAEKMNFIWFDNYIRLFKDPHFSHSLVVTLVFMAVVTLAGYIIGMSSALLFNRQFPAKQISVLLVCLPWAIPGAIASYIFYLLFQSPWGLLSYFFSWLGLDINWLIVKPGSLFMVIVTAIWKSYPLVTMSILAGMQSIPTELYEAADMDGAGALKKFLKITLPALNSITVVVLLLNGSWAFRNFEIIWILTEGGPGRFTETLGLNLYTEGFRFFDCL